MPTTLRFASFSKGQKVIKNARALLWSSTDPYTHPSYRTACTCHGPCILDSCGIFDYTSPVPHQPGSPVTDRQLCCIVPEGNRCRSELQTQAYPQIS